LRNPTLRATTLALVSRTSALDLSRGQSAASSREGQSEPIACLLDLANPTAALDDKQKRATALLLRR
jgi:hypothetical protein